MLSKEELSKIAEKKGLLLINTERDYLLEMILYALFQKVKDELVFKGGTALYKLYGLNRFSEDLDFTLMKHRSAVQEGQSPSAQKGKLSLLVPKFIEETVRQLSKLGVVAKIKEIRDYRQQINVHLECKGPLYTGGKETMAYIPLNLSLREKVQYPRYETLFSSYREIPSFELCVMGEAEIAAEKVRTILARDKARDVYDLWFLLKKGVKIDAELLKKKMKRAKISWNKKMLLDAIAAKEKMWEEDLQKLVLGNLPSFRKIQEELQGLLSAQI